MFRKPKNDLAMMTELDERTLLGLMAAMTYVAEPHLGVRHAVDKSLQLLEHVDKHLAPFMLENL